MPTKKPSARGATKPVKTAPVARSAQREAEARTRALIARFAPRDARGIAGLRRALRARVPGAHELVYEYRDAFVISYSHSGKGHEGVLALRGDADGVRLYFNRGAALADPDRVLQGTGRLVRYVAITGGERAAGDAARRGGAAMLTQPAIARLIDAAIADHPTLRGGSRRAGAGAAKRAATGSSGAVVIRPTTASRKARPA